MKSNDNIPEDEFLLAELIAVTSAAGLKGCKYHEFRAENGDSLTSPKGAAYCCAFGAIRLSGKVNSLFNIHTIFGNDADESACPSVRDCPTVLDEDNLKCWNIGAAFNIAMESPYEQ